MSEAQALHVPFNVRATDKETEFEIIQVKAGSYMRTHVILIETKRENHLEHTGGLHYGRASIQLRAIYLAGDALRSGDLVSDMGGRMDSFSRSVKLTNGGVMVRDNLRNLHIGSFMFNKIIAWAQEFDQTYNIVPIGVIAADAKTEEDMGIRNKFYENAGLKFIWDEGQFGLQGRTDPSLTVRDLKLRKYWPNIERDYQLAAIERIWRDLELAKDRAKVLRAANRYNRHRLNRFEGRLRIALSFVNWPMYVVLLVAGFAAGRGLAWVQSTFPTLFS